ncbi:thioredoxin-like protein [Leptodontidium sp. MPI-SDFR-AT-0119]|nr:thioredoxin-like protein [Leptodontidium sp. MPI-SDFR-AT-0119]
MAASTPQFTLHTHKTYPAAFKVALVLSLLHLSYKSIYFDSESISRDKKLKWFAKLNPNGRSPVLVGHAQNGHVVWESTAMLIYLVSMYDTENTLWQKTMLEQSQVNQWLLLQASG